MQAAEVTKSTEAPFWYALLILLRYRTRNNYMSPAYLGSRLLDKAIYTFLIFTFYWHVGKNLSQENVPNIGGMLFFWCVLLASVSDPIQPRPGNSSCSSALLLGSNEISYPA